MTRILLTGKDGQLGFELRRALAPLGELFALCRDECDLADPVRLAQLVRDIRPDVVVNAAAYTAVDKAESEPERAFAINERAPGVLAEEAARLSAVLIHYSTDYVFDGCRPAPYRESDATSPANVYGRSKLAGELAVMQRTPRHLVLRTAWVFGAHGGNFLKTMLRLAAERDSLKVVADQRGAPTSAALIADVTAQLLGHMLREDGRDFPFGLYHLAASGATTWHEYARTVVSGALARGWRLRAHPEHIQPIPSAEYPLPAPRPANSLLDTSLLRETFGITLPDWRDGVKYVLTQLIDRPTA